MEFCNTDRIGTGTGTGAHDGSNRGLYPAPDRDERTDAEAAVDIDTALVVPPRRLRRATSPANSTEVRAMSSSPAAGSILCIIEPNADIAEGLQHLLHTLPGVERVVAHATTAELLQAAANCANASIDITTTDAAESADVVAFSATVSATTRAAHAQPDIVLFDAGRACDSDARSWSQVRASMLEIQRTLPGSALVLMSVYPERLPDAVRTLATASIRKDTTRQELAELISQVRRLRADACTLADAAGA